MSGNIYGSSLIAAKSKANYLFDGDFRRKPSQNLSGASRSLARVELLQQAAQQRQTREDTRRKEDAALKIQSLYRGYRGRSTLAATLRQKFDTHFRRYQQHEFPSDDLISDQHSLLTRALIVFYHSQQDERRLQELIKLIMKRRYAFLKIMKINSQIWVYKICKLLIMCTGVVRKLALDDYQLTHADTELSSYLEFLMIFTRLDTQPLGVLTDSEASYVWNKLIKYSFFPTMRALYNKNLHVELSLELMRRSLDTDPTQINPCDIKPAYCFLQQYFAPAENYTEEPLGLEPLNPALVELVFTSIFQSRPRLLEPNLILQAFKESHNMKSRLSSHSEMHFGMNQSHMQNIQEIKESLRMCYLMIKSLSHRIDVLSDLEKVDYINLVWIMLEPAEFVTNISMIQAEHIRGPDQIDEDELIIDPNTSYRIPYLVTYNTNDIHIVITEILELINQLPHINNLKSIIFNGSLQNLVQVAIVKICNLMLSHESLAIFNCRLLYTVAFSKQFSRSLWGSIVTATSPSMYMSSTPIHVQIARGSQVISEESWSTILPKLKLFCSLFSYLLPTLGDDEFYTREENQIYSLTHNEHPEPASSSSTNDIQISGFESNSSLSTFYFDKELVGISAVLRDMAIGLVEIIYQRNQQLMNQSFSPMRPDNMCRLEATMSEPRIVQNAELLSFQIKSSFQALVRILCQLHARDSRKQFCPESHWICQTLNLPSKKSLEFALSTIQRGRLLDQILGRSDKYADLQLNVSSEIKTVLIIQEIPFVMSFQDRVKIFHHLLERDRTHHRSRHFNLNYNVPNSLNSIRARRNYIYEDAFEKLCLNKKIDLKTPLRVSMISQTGLTEAGIDGGGLFKEFLNELLKAGFDPMRGFFKYTNDNFLYPNPSSNVLFANLNEGYLIHYEFLGKILGLAIYEKNLVELPFASFFVAKLLAATDSSDIDLHNLESLDPVLYKNLVYLKNYKGDVADLDLDFTISNNDLDEHEVIELKPGGSKIAVTRENKIEYVHLVADYRLNKQIRRQCSAFKRGLAQLIELNWLRMFDSIELQILISGTPSIIDVDDWRKHTRYCSGYTDKNPAIEAFWAAVRRFSENSKRKLLKFATSCSLPPLLGFKDLNPWFAIAPSEEQRLPTSSTCMNLLKLPQIEDVETMHSKLLYAIESNSGFELS